VDELDPSAEAPSGGAAMGFIMKIKASTLLNIEMGFEMYMWPHSNAGITLIVLRDPETMTADDVQEIVDAADRKVRAAAGAD
jgi:hypothetical protein